MKIGQVPALREPARDVRGRRTRSRCVPLPQAPPAESVNLVASRQVANLTPLCHLPRGHGGSIEVITCQGHDEARLGSHSGTSESAVNARSTRSTAVSRSEKTRRKHGKDRAIEITKSSPATLNLD